MVSSPESKLFVLNAKYIKFLIDKHHAVKIRMGLKRRCAIEDWLAVSGNDCEQYISPSSTTNREYLEIHRVFIYVILSSMTFYDDRVNTRMSVH